MPNLVDTLLAQALDPILAPPTEIDQKKAEVQAASEIKKLDFSRVGKARSTGKGSLGVGEFQWDMQNLTAGQIQQKYGPDAAAAFNQGISGTLDQNAADRQALDDRHAGNVLWDSGTGILSGGIGGLAGIVAMGAGAVDDEAGAWVSEKVQDGTEWVEGIQSDGINAARRQQRLESSLDAWDNEAQMKQEIADGADDSLAGMRRWGRDVVDTVKNSTDPAMFIQGSAEAAGSLLAGGPLAKGLKAMGGAAMASAGARGAGRIGPMTANSARVASFGEKAAWPLATAGLEGGGAYTGTVDEINNMTFDDLRQNSPDFAALEAKIGPEAARFEIANDAGMRAAAVQGSVAALTAGLTRFAEKPFKVPSLKSGAQNVLLNEPLEEAIQGTSGALAQNEAIQKYADTSRDLSKGAGEQTALGALYGAGSAATIQGPGMALRTPAAIASGAKTSAEFVLDKFKNSHLVQSASRVGGAVKQAAAEKAQTKIMEADAASPVNEKRVQEAAAEVQAQLPDWAIGLHEYLGNAKDSDKEQAAKEVEYLNNLDKAFWLTSEDGAYITESLRPVMMDKANRIDAIHALAGQIEKLPVGSQESLEAIAAYEALTQPLRALQNADLSLLGSMPEDNPHRQRLDAIRTVVANSINSTVDRRANQNIDSMVKDGAMPITEEQISDTAIKTPEGQAAAKAALALTTMRPGSGSVAINTQLMKHAENGFLNMTAEQRAGLRASLVILQEQEKINKARDIDKMTFSDVVNGQIVSDPGSPLAKKRDSAAGMSARQHINGIMKMIQSGNLSDAREMLEDFGKFAQHMQNKLSAVNEHYEKGNGRAPGKVGYQALSPDLTSKDTRQFYQAPQGMWVNMDNDTSLRIAQSVGVEAETLANIYNGMAEVVNELSPDKLPLIDVETLNPNLKGSIADVQKRHPKPAKQEKNKPAPKPEAKTESKPAVKEETVIVTPVETKPVVSKEVAVVEDKKPEPVVEKTPATVETRTQPEAEEVVVPTLEPVKPDQFDVPPTTGNQNTPFVFTPKNDEQRDAVEKISAFLSPENTKEKVFVVEGKAGTGKTTIMMAALQDALKSGTAITISAISHKAKKVLEDKINEVRVRNKYGRAFVEAKSVAGLLGMKMNEETGDFTPDAYAMRTAPIKDAEIIVVDEASMLGPEAIELILKHKRPETKVIFLGDIGQLAPIGESTVSPVFTMKAPRVRLVERVRQGEDSAILPYADVYWNNSQDSRPSSNPIEQTEREKSTSELEFLTGTNQLLDRYLGVFKHAMQTLNPNLIKIIAYNNKLGTAQQAPMLRRLEAKIRMHLYGDTPKAFESGEMIIFNDNYRMGKTQIDNSSEFVVRRATEKKDKVYTNVNGEAFEGEFKTHILTIENGDEKYVVAALDPEESNRQAWKNYLNRISAEIKSIKDPYAKKQAWSAFYEAKERYADVAFSYVITSHKSQGSTYQVSIVLEDNFHRGMGMNVDMADKSRGLYTAVTRAAQRAVIVSNLNPVEAVGKPEFAKQETKSHTTMEEEHREFPEVETLLLEAEASPEREAESVPEETVDPIGSLASNVADDVEANEAAGESVTDNSKDRAKMLELFPDLHFVGDHGLLSSMSPVEGTSRGAEVENPASMVADALSSQADLEEVAGETEHAMTKKVAAGYSKLMDESPSGLGLGGMLDVMANNLRNFLDKKDSKGVSNRNKIKSGVDVNRWKNGKALNIMNADMTYNSQLLQSAALAGLQWVLETRQAYNSDNEDSDYESMTGIKDASMLKESIKTRLNTGQSIEQIKPLLAAKIRSYWGLKPRSDQDIAYAKGISEAVAAEVLTALFSVRLLDIDPVVITEEDGLPPMLDKAGKPRVNRNGDPVKNKKTLNRYIIAQTDATKAVEPYPSAIEEVMVMTPERVRYIDGDIPPVATHQMNNPDVANTADQKKALEIAGKTEHKTDPTMLHAMVAIGEAGIVRWLGGRKPSWTDVDPEHEKSLKGREDNARNAFNEILATVSEMSNRATKSGKSVFDTAIRYAYNMSKVGRMQMLGSYTGQANKLTRHVITPTWSTLDLVNNDKHQQNFFLAITQHLDDIKLNKNFPADAIAATKADLSGKYAPLVQYLQEWVADQDLSKEPVANNKGLDIEKILELAGKDLEVAGLTSLIEYARFLNADEAGKSSFRTSLYLEADGVTNGPIMAMMMLTSGVFTKEWIANIAKGGVGFGTAKPIYALDKTEQIDLYQTATTMMVTARNQLLQKFSGKSKTHREITENIAALELVMRSLFGDDVTFNEETKELTFKRGIAKNPLTITLYGSMPDGIAGNFASRLLDALNERRTELASQLAANPTLTPADVLFNGDQDANQRYEDAFTLLSTTYITQSREGEFYRAKQHKGQNDFEVLSENFLYGLVMPLVVGIRNTVGSSLMDNMTTLRRATQVQSIFLELAYKQAINDLLIQKKKDDPTRKANDFLSQDELNKISREMTVRFPNVKTSAQVFRVAKSKRDTDDSTSYSEGLDERHRTGNGTYNPSNAGVSGIASLVIGFGDGYMVQVGIQDAAMKSVLPVFDGINMPLDTISDSGVAANKAAYEAFMNNPMRAVQVAYDEFVKQLDKTPVQLDDDALHALAWAFQEEGEPAMSPEEMAENLDKALFGLGANLAFTAKSIEARHLAQQDVQMFVDHMAASGSVYSNDVAPQEMTKDQTLAMLNERYDFHMKQVSDKVPMTLKSADAPIDKTIDVQLVRSDYFPALARELGLTEDQQNVMTNVLGPLVADDYMIVSGTKEQIIAYRLKHGLPVDDIHDTDNGFISVGEKRIYLIGADGEVLTHELVHAATFEKLVAHYNGNTNPEVTKAVQELELMMEEFKKMTADVSAPFELQQAMASAQAEIAKYENATDMDPVLMKAGALNEFMAWSLASQPLMEKLKATPVPAFVKWSKAVLDFVKKLFGGKGKLDVSFLSALQFNTRVLIRNQPSLGQGFKEVTLHHRNAVLPSLTAVRDLLERNVVSHVKQLEKVNQDIAARRVAQYLVEANELAESVANVFHLSDLEKTTLASVVSALGTSIKLDPNVLARMQSLYTHAQKNLDLKKHFIDKDAADPVAEAHWANDKMRIILGRSSKTDPQGLSSMLPVFVGLSMVSPEFQKVLGKLESPKKTDKTGSTDQKVRQVGVDAMEGLAKLTAGEGQSQTVQQAMNALNAQMYQTLTNERGNLTMIEETSTRGLAWANTYLRDLMTAASNKGVAQGNKMSASANKVVRGAGAVLRLTAGLADEKNGEQVAEGALKTAERIGLNNALFNLVKDFVGRTGETADIYDLIKPIRVAVQQMRQQFRDSVPKIITDAFSKAPTKEQYATMTRAMANTDLASLLFNMSKADVAKLFSDDTFRASEISTLESQIRSLDPRHFTLLQKKMKQLAAHQNTKSVGSNLLRNAYAIASLWNENASTRRQAPSRQLVEAIDQLTTLYAVDTLRDADKASMASLFATEQKGVEFLLSYLEGQRTTEIAKTKLGRARDNHYKGYMHSLPTKTGHVMVADDADYSSMIQKGYTRVSDYKGSSVLGGGASRGYYYSSVPSRAAFAQGLIQNVDQSAYGVNPATGFSTDMVAGRITNKRRVAQLAAAMHTETGTTENLMPIYDRGRVIAFEQAIDVRQLDKLEKSEQIHDMVGVWRGRQIEELFAIQKNKVLIDTMKRNWDDNKNHNPDLYVNLLDPKVLDSVERDAVHLFSEETKEYAKKVFGPGVLMVRKSQLEDVTGYRNPSVSDFWTNINRFTPETNKAIKDTIISMFGVNAYKNLVNIESMIQGFTSDLRTMIVVKSMVVPLANTMSNIYQLMGRGVNPIRIARETPKIVSQLNSYLSSQKEQVKLEAELRATKPGSWGATRLEAQIRSIKDAQQRLSIWPLIVAGEFSSVADVGLSRDDLELSSGRINQWLEKKVDQLPAGLKTAAKYGMVSKDTALFHGLQKSVQYSDFVAKAILYDHLLRNENHTREQALARITEEFINYDRLPGRTRGGLENMGLLWFYNFKLRSVKVALSTLRNNPLHALLVGVLPTPMGIGTPLMDNAITKGLEGQLGWSIGPGMAFRAPLMNPWVNVIH